MRRGEFFKIGKRDFTFIREMRVSRNSIPLIDFFLPPNHTLIFYPCMDKCLFHVRGKILIKFDEAKV